jgi:hypothetical protein
MVRRRRPRFRGGHQARTPHLSRWPWGLPTRSLKLSRHGRPRLRLGIGGRPTPSGDPRRWPGRGLRPRSRGCAPGDQLESLGSGECFAARALARRGPHCRHGCLESPKPEGGGCRADTRLPPQDRTGRFRLGTSPGSDRRSRARSGLTMMTSLESRSDCQTCRSMNPSWPSTSPLRPRNASMSSGAWALAIRRRESEMYMSSSRPGAPRAKQ